MPWLLVLVTAIASVAFAESGTSDEITADAGIEPQPLSSAIEKFAEQSGLQIIYRTEVAAGIYTSGAAAGLSNKEKLDQLLARTGLGYQFVNDRTVAIKAVPNGAAAPAVNGGTEQDLMVQNQSARGELMSTDSPTETGKEQRAAESSRSHALQLEEIVVTGSRLQRSTTDSPIPVTTITAEDVELSGVTAIGDLVNKLPAMGFGANRQTNIGVAAPAEIGTNLLDLRQLGTQRTLVVVNGRRHVGSVAGSTAVDVNSIPTALVERVDVSTGGASVAYGADAVSGVVNFVLKDDFEGVQLDGQYGISNQGDAEDMSISITGGGNFGNGRGNAVLSASYNDTQGVFGTDRDWVVEQAVFVRNPDDTGPNDGIPANIRARDGRIAALPLNTLYLGLAPYNITNNAMIIDDDGILRPFDAGIPGGIFNIGGDGLNLAEVTTITNPLKRVSISGNLHYDLNDYVRFFMEGKYYTVKSSNAGQPTASTVSKPDGSLFLIDADNPYAPFGDPAFDDFYAGNFGFVVLARFHEDLGARTVKVDRDTYRVVTGIEGQFPGTEWNYEVYYQYGESDTSRMDLNERDERRFQFATDVTTDTAGVLGVPGAPVCRARLDAGAVATGDPAIDLCVPLNVFGAMGDNTQEARDFVRLNLLTQSELSQHVVTATVAGDMFDLPAGSASFAAGAEYRRERSSFEPDNSWIQGIGYDGVRLPVFGEYDVLEGYLEMRLPLLTDKPGAQLLAIEGGVRISDYSTVGSTTAWRVGAEWAPVEDIRFRAAKAIAVRSPNISELFAPVGEGRTNILDPCDKDNVNLGPDPARRLANCTAMLAPLGLDPLTFDDPLASITNTTITGGNPNLIEEAADSLTAGIVFTPRWVEDLVLTIDYFNITIDDAIATPSTRDIVEDCVDRFDTIDNNFCDLFSRSTGPADYGAIQNVIATQLNVDALETRGVDFGANYNFPVGAGGTLDFQLVGTYLSRLRTLPAGDAASYQESAGEYSHPTWRANLQTTYHRGPLAVNWRMRWVDSAVIDVQDKTPQESYDPYKIGGGSVNDVQARYAFDDFTAFFGVNDVFDTAPPFWARGLNTASARGFYDPVGRFFYGGFKVSFGSKH